MLARDRLGDWPGATAEDPRGLPNAERKISNVVLMGMGEPLYNFDNVRDACAVAADGEGLGIGKRRITLSTSGVVPEIPRWGEEAGTMLAISLHAVRDELRDKLVPINKKWPIKELLQACRNYPGLSNAKRITFEYVMLKGVNDSVADAKELVRLLAKIPAKINLIPFNPWPGAPYECSDWEQIEKFAEVVNRAGYASPVRSPRGRDIMAACGQLRSESVKQRASTPLSRADAGKSSVAAICISRHVKASRATVYRALLDAAAVAGWRVPTGMTSCVHEFDAREGGTFRISLTYDSQRGTGKTSSHTDTYRGSFVKLVRDTPVVELVEFETADPALTDDHHNHAHRCTRLHRCHRGVRGITARRIACR